MQPILLDDPIDAEASAKNALAQCMGHLYAQVMQFTPDLINVTIRELRESSLDESAENAPILSCDVSRRTPEERALLGEVLLDACVETLGLDPDKLSIEFTQRVGAEGRRKFIIDGALGCRPPSQH